MRSVQARFFVSVATNLLKSSASFLTSILLARAMGVSEYGNLQFLAGTALVIRQFLDAGSSNAYFTFISQKQRGGRVLGVYFLWLAVQVAVTLLFLAALAVFGGWSRVWLGQSPAVVIVAVFSAVAMDGVWGTLVNIGESIRKTHIVQAAGLGVSILYLASVVSLWMFGLLQIRAILWISATLYLVSSAAVLWWLWRFEGFILGPVEGEWSVSRVVHYFIGYCRPLMLLTAVSFLYNFADDWLLQNYGGSRQQGIFGVSQQISTIVLLMTTSFLKVFWKEIAEAVESGSEARARDLYQTASRALYFVSAAISAWMIPLSRPIVELTLGPQYGDAALPLAVMLLFPIHQTVGQLNGTFFYASNQVKTYARIGMAQMIFFLPITYFLLASRDAAVPGLGLGAVGLPLKMVCHQLLAVNINAWMISRMQRCRYEWRYQFVVLAVLLAVSFGATRAAEALLPAAAFTRRNVALMALSAPLYGAAVFFLLERCPEALGLRREEYFRVRDAAVGFWRARFAVA